MPTLWRVILVRSCYIFLLNCFVIYCFFIYCFFFWYFLCVLFLFLYMSDSSNLCLWLLRIIVSDILLRCVWSSSFGHCCSTHWGKVFKFLAYFAWEIICCAVLRVLFNEGLATYKHGSFFLDVGVGRIDCCGVRDEVLGLYLFLIYETCDQLLLLWARIFSCWFACPLSLSLSLSLLNEKFSTCCGVRVSDSKSM